MRGIRDILTLAFELKNTIMKTIKEIAKSHRMQMSSVSPGAIEETIEDAINEYASQLINKRQCKTITIDLNHILKSCDLDNDERNKREIILDILSEKQPNN